MIKVVHNVSLRDYGVNFLISLYLYFLKSFGLEDAGDKYPSEVSGGMQQRIAIARAIITDPKILFGDEPTGALNSTTGEEVLDILADLNSKGQTVVMVTHDVKVAARASRVIYLKDGRIDGELNLEPFPKKDYKKREGLIFEFLNERGW